MTRFAAGDRVFGVVTKAFLDDGGFGEYVVVGDQLGTAAIPDGLDTGTAGVLGLAGTAALDALTAAAPRAGETVLVSGAADVVDPTGDVAAQVRAVAPGGVDVVLHLAGDGPALSELLAGKGRLSSTLGFGPDRHPAAVAIMATPAAETLDRLAADAAAGRLTVPVSRTYALAEIPDAFGDFAGGTLGQLAITLA